ncbi:MAG: exonuclease domain-containing protein [Succinivibrio sp.]
MLNNIFDPLEKLQRRCNKFASSPKCPDELREFYKRELPKSSDNIKDVKIISIDFETTGIDLKKDLVLSIGGITISHGSIDFSTAFHKFLKIEGKVSFDSAVINHITPEQLIDGEDPKKAMTELFSLLSGNAALVHCRFIEANFIRKTLDLPQNAPLPFVILDTMQIEREIHRYEKNLDVRLSSIRERRGLPPYDGHNALTDSLATAELFLTQVKDVFKSKKATLLPMYKRS